MLGAALTPQDGPPPVRSVRRRVRILHHAAVQAQPSTEEPYAEDAPLRETPHRP
jgi:hypothetical protein